MLVPGAIAATSAAIVMNTPAEAARAPEGLTHGLKRDEGKKSD
jgi:hypothetical protein